MVGGGGSTSIITTQKRTLFVTVAVISLTLVFFPNPTLSADPPTSSPPSISPSSSPPPAIPPASPSSPPSISPSNFNSPPAPPPPDLAPTSPSPADEDPSSSPSPSPAPESENGSNRAADPNSAAGDLKSGDGDDDSSKRGLSAGQKAGVALAVIGGVCVVGLGALVYRKRQQNLQRAQYGQAARREYL